MKDQRAPFTPLSDLVKTAATQIEGIYHRQPSSRYRYGFHALDEMTGGMHPTDRVAVIAEDPDLATALLISIVHSLVVGDGVAARLASARHDETYLAEKLLSIESGISEVELRSGMLQPHDFSALTDAAGVLHAAPLDVASIDPIDAIGLTDFVQELARSECWYRTAQEPHFIDGVSVDVESEPDIPVLRKLDADAKDEKRPVVVSFDTSLEQWRERRCDRWFDVVLRIQRSEINRDDHDAHTVSVEIQITRNRYGTVGTVYLEYIPPLGCIHDIDAQPVAMTDLHRSLEKINACHGETLRRLGEGPHESEKEEEST
jgi:replicative DNA helicase